jgi:hypothetical protein
VVVELDITQGLAVAVAIPEVPAALAQVVRAVILNLLRVVAVVV